MQELASRIAALSDDAAVQVLATITKARQRREPAADLPDAAALAQALRATAAAAPAAGPVSERALAKQALLVLAADERERPAVHGLVENAAAPRQQFAEPVTTALVLAGVALVLKTHVKLERGPDGRWTFLLESKPLADPLLQGLLNTLAGFFRSKSS